MATLSFNLDNAHNCSVNLSINGEDKGVVSTGQSFTINTYDNIDITCKTNDGYIFDPNNPPQIRRPNGKYTNMTIASNKIATYHEQFTGNSWACRFNVQTIQDTTGGKTLKFSTLDLNNCIAKLYINDTFIDNITLSTTHELNGGDRVKIECICNDGFKFDSTQIESISGLVSEFERNSTNTIATYIETVPSTPIDWNCKVWASTKQSKTITFSTLELNNCIAKLYINDAFIDNISLSTTHELSGGDSVKIECICNDGYIFDSTTPNSTQIQSISGLVKEFERDSTYTIASYIETVPSAPIDWNCKIWSTAVLKSAPKSFVKVYKPNDDELSQLSVKRYFTVDQGIQDLSQYILSLRKSYFDFQSPSRERVYFGRIDTTIESDVISQQIQSVFIGQIDINGRYSNSNDYDATIEIYLPFIGFQSLDTRKYMNRTIGIEYRLNATTLECKAILSSNNIVLNTYIGNIGYDIPILNGQLQGVIGIPNFNQNAEYLTGIKDIKVNIINNDILMDDDDTLPDNAWILIETQRGKGFSKFSDSKLVGILNKDVIEEIRIILNSGVWL